MSVPELRSPRRDRLVLGLRPPCAPDRTSAVMMPAPVWVEMRGALRTPFALHAVRSARRSLCTPFALGGGGSETVVVATGLLP